MEEKVFMSILSLRLKFFFEHTDTPVPKSGPGPNHDLFVVQEESGVQHEMLLGEWHAWRIRKLKCHSLESSASLGQGFLWENREIWRSKCVA